MALDRNGFKRKTYDDIVNEMSAKAKELLGADANVSERAVLGILIRVVAWFLALLWQDLEDVYHSAYRKSAEGVQLDKLLPYAGTGRELADYATGQVELTGTPNYPVETGFLVGTESDINFETLHDVTLDANGKGLVEIACTAIGPVGNVEVGEISVIVNPNADVLTVVNQKETSGGRERETDNEARTRAEITGDGLGSATSKSIRAAVVGLSSVRAAQVYENDSDELGLYNTPANSFQVFVLGGDDQGIAEAIYSKKTAGITAYGTTQVTVLDSSGKEKAIGFTRAIEKAIKARITLRTNAYFNAASIGEIKDAFIAQIGGVASNGVLHAGLNMGGDVIHSKLINLAFTEGVDDVTLLVGIDNNLQAANIVIGDNEVAQIDAEDIEVIVNV